MKTTYVLALIAVLVWSIVVAYLTAALPAGVYWGRTFLAWLGGVLVIVLTFVSVPSMVRSRHTMTAAQRLVLAGGVPAVTFLIGAGLIQKFVSRRIDDWDETWWAWALLSCCVVAFEYWLFGAGTSGRSSHSGTA